MAEEADKQVDGDLSEWWNGAYPAIRKLYVYWDSKRAGRRMPSRADIEPLEIPKLLRYLLLVDVVPDERRYVYRLVGSAEVMMRGRDPTGRPVGEAYFGPSLENVFGCYDRVVGTRAPFFDDDVLVDSKVGRKFDNQLLFLPLSPDGENVNMVMVISVRKERRE